MSADRLLTPDELQDPARIAELLLDNYPRNKARWPDEAAFMLSVRAVCKAYRDGVSHISALEGIVREAPHGESCQYLIREFSPISKVAKRARFDCNCWKSRTPSAPAPEKL